MLKPVIIRNSHSYCKRTLTSGLGVQVNIIGCSVPGSKISCVRNNLENEKIKSK